MVFKKWYVNEEISTEQKLYRLCRKSKSLGHFHHDHPFLLLLAIKNSRLPLPSVSSRRSSYQGEHDMSISHLVANCLFLRLSSGQMLLRREGLPSSVQSLLTKWMLHLGHGVQRLLVHESLCTGLGNSGSILEKTNQKDCRCCPSRSTKYSAPRVGMKESIFAHHMSDKRLIYKI